MFFRVVCGGCFDFQEGIPPTVCPWFGVPHQGHLRGRLLEAGSHASTNAGHADCQMQEATSVVDKLQKQKQTADRLHESADTPPFLPWLRYHISDPAKPRSSQDEFEVLVWA